MKSFLIFRNGAIGDIIHTLPLVRILAKSHQPKKITYAMSEELVDLFEYATCIDQIIPLNFKTNRIFKTAQQIKQFGEFTDFVNLQPSWKTKLLAWLLKIPGYHQYQKNKTDFAQAAWLNFALTYFHKADLDLTEFQPVDYLPLFSLPKPKPHNSHKIAFILGVGAHRAHRAWPLKNWLQLLKLLKLQEQINTQIVLIGGLAEVNLAKEFLHYANQNNNSQQIENLVGKLSLLETALALQECKLAIGGDTGPIHLAAALGVYSIGLFGPTSAERHHPFMGASLQSSFACAAACTPKKCGRKTLTCMEGLSPEQVWLYLNNSYSIV